MSAQDYSVFIGHEMSAPRVFTIRHICDALTAIFKECLQRRKLKKMLQLNASQLQDCGVDRSELIAALGAPLFDRAALHLTQSRTRRAKSI